MRTSIRASGTFDFPRQQAEDMTAPKRYLSRQYGLAVDSLMGEEELVIKALEDELITSPMVSGASILGDGTVVLILNVSAVVAHLSRIPAVGAIA